MASEYQAVPLTKKANVLAALGKRDLNLKESGSSSKEEDADVQVEEEEEGTGNEGEDSDSKVGT